MGAPRLPVVEMGFAAHDGESGMPQREIFQPLGIVATLAPCPVLTGPARFPGRLALSDDDQIGRERNAGA
jgi:hypothetical protein